MPKQTQNLSLIIANKNYSSWSLRAWLVLHAFDIDFQEVQLELFSDEFKQTLAQYHATGKVPLLIDSSKTNAGKEKVIWDSLAIAEYIAENYLTNTVANAWGKHKALARSLACEMHSGFFGIRNEMPMNIRATRKITPSQDCLKDIARINQIFSEYRAKFKHEGDYLLGEFGIVDSFYAPVVFRFATYASYSGIILDKEAQSYCDNMLNHPSMLEWQRQALLETSIITEDEAGEEVS